MAGRKAISGTLTGRSSSPAAQVRSVW